MTAPAKVWSYRNLIANLVLRNLRARYKKSFLGWGWSLVNPAVTLGIYTIVFGLILSGQAPRTGSGDDGVFALWLFAALVAWNSFSGGITTAMTSFLDSGHMLTRTYFPPECPVIAGTLTVAIQSAIETAILVVFMLVLGNVGWTTVLVVPIMALLTLLSFGAGLIVSLGNVRFRDVNYLVGIALQIGFYATPIVYRLDQLPDDVSWIKTVLSFNPLTHFTTAMRDVTYLLENPTALNWAVMVLAPLVVVSIGWWVFSSKAPRYIEEI
jgi:ABC-2 type transport system permease protein